MKTSPPAVARHQPQGAGPDRSKPQPPPDAAAPVAALDPDLLQRLAGFFSGLGDPNRLRIIDFLSRREACVCDIADALGMRPSTVSHQLRALRHLRLVRSRRDGRHIHYRLHDHHVLQLHRIALEHLLEIHPRPLA